MWNLYVMGKATLWFAVGGATIPACSLFPVSAKQWNQYYKLAAIIGERSTRETEEKGNQNAWEARQERRFG